jgi:sulfur carrier protein
MRECGAAGLPARLRGVMALTLILNGQSRVFETLAQSASLEQLIGELGLKGDRVAVEHNGEIVPRAGWAGAAVNEGYRLEVVHFVGGGGGGLLASF